MPLLVGALVLLVVPLFWPTFLTLHEKWTYSTAAYSHGYLVVAISLWLIVRAAEGRKLAPQVFWPALLVLLLATLAWFAAWLADVMIVQALAIPLIIYLALVAAFGMPSAKVWLFPVGYLLFAIPFWDYFNGVLQEMTIAASTTVLNAARIPAFITGSIVELPNGTFEIASGCAGLHFFIAALALATLYAYLFLDRLRSQVILIAVTAALAIFMNWFRVTTIIFAGYATDMQHYLVKVDHYNYGWVLFAIILIPLYVLARRLEIADIKAEEAAGEQKTVADKSSNTAISSRTVLARTVIVAAVAAVGPAVALAMSWPDEATATYTLNAPEQIGEWQDAGDARNTLTVSFKGPLAEVRRQYIDTHGNRLWLYANHYARQSQGSELIGSGNRLYDIDAWDVVGTGAAELRLGDAGPVVLTTRIAAGNGAQRILAYWYDVAGKAYTREIDVKLAEFIATLRARPGSGVRMLAVECSESCETASARLQTLLQQNFTQINKQLTPFVEPKDKGQ